MNSLSDKQIKEIQEACLSSHQRGYKEGFSDACKQLRVMSQQLAESVESVINERSKK